jgi:hypothetical protein
MDSLLGRWRIDHYRREFRAAKARQDGMYHLRELKGRDPREPQLRRIWGHNWLTLSRDFPNREDLILPTRLGNVIRAAERYPKTQYGMESIILWPRLVNVLDAKYTRAVDDARTSLDLMLNSSVISALLATLVVILGLVYSPQPLGSRVLWPALLFVLLAAGFYQFSIRQAYTWGELFKAAFDLYRWDLLEKLGYQQAPTTKTEERDLWNSISNQLMLGDRRTGAKQKRPYPEYASLSVTPTPGGIMLETARGLLSRETDGTVTFACSIRRVDEMTEEVQRLVLTVALPVGFEYKWNSARVGSDEVRVIGTNPYHFYIEGEAAKASDVELIYSAVPRQRAPMSDTDSVVSSGGAQAPVPTVGSSGEKV